MIPANEYVEPEPRGRELSPMQQRFAEYVSLNLDGSDATRTRWITQRTLQAVGTGAVLTCAYLHGSGLIFRVLKFESIWHVADRAVQSARIGFGAL